MYTVCPAEDLAPGEKRGVVLGRRQLVVVRSASGEYFALADACPHQGARLSAGHLSGAFSASSVGQPSMTRPGEIIRCPWHNFAYDVRTGRSLLDPARYRVRTYRTVVEDGQLLVEMP